MFSHAAVLKNITIGPDKDSVNLKLPYFSYLNHLYFLTHQFKHVFGCSKEPSR